MKAAVRSNLKQSIYQVCKLLGLFHIARRLTRRGLRILCYHGFAMSDESKFCPALFIEASTFEERLRYLEKHRYNLLPLEEAYYLLAEDRLPDSAVVLTIDDGYYSTVKHAQPVLLRHSFPATVYVTSYYCVKQNPIFRLAVQYMFWKTKKEQIDLSGLGLPSTFQRASTRPEVDGERLMWEVIRFGESHLDEHGRRELALRLGERTEVSYETLESDRILTLMNSEEIGDLAAAGLDVQLHTHRHYLPVDKTLAQREIIQNRAYLEPIVKKRLNHFCYPSGVWTKDHWPWLSELGVITATTCDVGLNYHNTAPLGLKRFLDGENINAVEFEAEMSGFSELIRIGRSHLSEWFRRPFRFAFGD